MNIYKKKKSDFGKLYLNLWARPQREREYKLIIIAYDS